MRKDYNIWNAYLNRNTKNWDGKEWVIDGEIGRMTYPGDLPLATVCEYYKNGKSFEVEGKSDAQL